MKIIKSGVIGNVNPEFIMVESSSDLTELEVPVGSIAYTAGFGTMWQLAADGDWEEIE